jgi:hypothetical protein
MAWLMNFRIKKAAIGVLRKELGWKRLLRLIPGLSKRQKLGEPWTGMSPPEDQKDRDSRALIGDAILLYRELQRLEPSVDAERIVRRGIIESAIMQLYTLIPQLSKAAILKLAPEERKNRFCGIVAQFPNADWNLTKADETEFGYLIHRCRLVELIVAAGHPELKDAFCAGDGIYFERHQPEIGFSRPTMIGKGDPGCEFNFSLK